MREGLWRTKKGGPKHIPNNHNKSNNDKKLNMGGGRGGAQRCASNFSLVTMTEIVRKSNKCSFAAQK